MALTARQQDAHIKIFVSAHKPAQFPEGDCILPIQVGAAQAATRFANTLHDDEGDNISTKNPMYCELTAQYWAWKNMDADYYGFCHYRRYFDFSDTEHTQNDYGEIIDTYIDERTIAEYGLDDASIARAVQGWDVITSPLNDVRRFGGFHDLKDHWNADRHLRLADLRHMYDILCQRHPDYRQDADAVLNGRTAAFCNMFIMRKDIFRAYNEWLFPLLDEFAANTNMDRADVQTLRTVGHLSERLLNVFLMHHRRIGTGWRMRQLQCVHFEHPEPPQRLLPLSDAVTSVNGRPVVPVVFAADDNYVPMLATTIHSMLSNASSDRHYDVIVLERNISAANKQALVDFFGDYANATVRFHDVSRQIDGFNLTTSNAHISIETYYRFIIQEALPFYAKILYLDCDLVVNGDVAELFDTELGDAAIGAVKDVDFLGNLNMKDGKRAAYAAQKLHMRNPYGYFQAGVLVMNLERMRKIHTVRQWLQIASQPGFIYNDQDILNMECEGSVRYLDYSWNVMHDCADRVQGVFAFAPAPEFKAYQESRKAPHIVHYAGFDKPWKNPWCDFATLYWRYAQATPFVMQMTAAMAGVAKPQPVRHHERVIAEDSPLRKYADVLAPTGSKQRELLKVVARKVQSKA